MAGIRIALVVRDQELRIISAIVRAKDFSDDVHIIDLGSKDGTLELLEQEEGIVLHNLHPDTTVPEVAAALFEEDGDYSSIVIRLEPTWKLRDLPVAINRTRMRNDVDMVFTAPADSGEQVNPTDLTYSDAPFQSIICSNKGLAALAEANPHSKPLDLPRELNVRVTRNKEQLQVNQRESLATASRFAQLFYWMLESKHPLISFGIPGVVLFSVGYLLSRDVIGTFDEVNSVSLGVALATFSVTIIGLLAIMGSIILYILGKQVKQIQLQYQEWPQE
ncbi:MAG: hypothetical protein QF817_01720 [Candidatus Poseidoniaceae archaeon]|nr:hypothetical protein [Candidatus Poseidoniaceae archaeon]